MARSADGIQAGYYTWIRKRRVPAGGTRRHGRVLRGHTVECDLRAPPWIAVASGVAANCLTSSNAVPTVPLLRAGPYFGPYVSVAP
jgi:hypothetical protein